MSDVAALAEHSGKPAESVHLRVLVEVVAVLANPFQLREDPLVVHAPAGQVHVVPLHQGRHERLGQHEAALGTTRAHRHQEEKLQRHDGELGQ